MAQVAAAPDRPLSVGNSFAVGRAGDYGASATNAQLDHPLPNRSALHTTRQLRQFLSRQPGPHARQPDMQLLAALVRRGSPPPDSRRLAAQRAAAARLSVRRHCEAGSATAVASGPGLPAADGGGGGGCLGRADRPHSSMAGAGAGASAGDLSLSSMQSAVSV